ncbi:hypothetical protein MXL91_13770 [Achromobacter ruhlandii]|uniref:hypothetical protein n=1 Tax=Achromobacter ruhlandii TaxID=72557 RepID=UPI002DBA89E5|nr:hypothetical protein [Achromobacter ruhlandii]MEB6662514.1 hypothetical protein [Achromobacter ruhlandii]
MTAPSSTFDVTVVLGPSAPVLAGRTARAPTLRTRLGKPYLPGLAGFGVSHSAGVQARLYANRKYVGIDIEHLDRPDLAARQRRLAAWLARRDLVAVDFLAGWVAREACAKSVGLGLLHALPRLSIAWVRPCGQDGTQEIGLVLSRWRFVARCERVGRVLLCVCYRQDYGQPALSLLRPGLGADGAVAASPVAVSPVAVSLSVASLSVLGTGRLLGAGRK